LFPSPLCRGISGRDGVKAASKDKRDEHQNLYL
jgi:hypothetical protein